METVTVYSGETYSELSVVRKEAVDRCNQCGQIKSKMYHHDYWWCAECLSQYWTCSHGH